MLETDAPYLTPHPHRGKRNEPAYIPLIAQGLAEIKNLDVAWWLRQPAHWPKPYLPSLP